MESNSNYRFTVILILGLLTAVGPLSIDMYLPAFPAIATSLNTTVSRVTLSLSSFFIGISFGQLLYGPLLERFGRKKPLYAGLFVYFLASVGCALARSVEFLILLRLFQALGGCVGMVAARAMVRDLFEVKDNAKVFSLLMLVVSVSPIIAPTLGGYISHLLGWRYIFIMMMLIVLVILIGTYFFLPESKKPDPSFSLKPGFIIRNFKSVLTHPQFITYALTGAISYAGLYAYLGGAPYVFMELYKLNEREFGWVFALIAAGLIGFSQVNSIMIKYFSGEQIIRIASFSQGIIGVILISLTMAGWINLPLTVFLIFSFVCCQGFIFPNSTALALSPLGHNAGNASALIGAIQMSVGGCASAIVSIFQNHTAVPMAVVMTCCAVSAFLSFYLGSKYIRSNIGPETKLKEDVEMMNAL